MSYSTLLQNGDNIYVNVTITAALSGILSLYTPAEYIVSKTIPILDKCDDYYCSIIRFAIPLSSVPLFIMPILPNQTNPNLTPFIIGITTGGINNYPQPVIFYAETNSGIPMSPNPIQANSPYYYVYEYQLFITQINTALALAFVASGLTGNCPYFYLNPATEEISLVVDIATFAPTATPTTPMPVPAATIFMNADLQIYLTAFQVISVAPLGSFSPIGKDFLFNLVRFGIDNTIPPFTIAATQKQFTQEYPVLQLWSSLRKIIVTTNSIPILNEFAPTNNSGSSILTPILTDFLPFLDFAGQDRTTAFYSPTSQYRLVDLKSSESLKTIDLKIYWQDINQNIYPLFVNKYQQISLKIGFFKKSLYKSSTPLLKK
jgi:hypothetical protein